MNKKLNLLLTILTITSLSACVNAGKVTKKTSSTGTITNPGIIGDGGFIGDGDSSGGSETTPVPGGSTPTDLTACADGIAREGATRCYYTLPALTFSGSGKAGAMMYWSSAYNLSNAFSSDIFRTDMNFAVRIRPIYAQDTTSFQGRTCSSYTKYNFSKMQVKLMLSKSSDNGLSDNIGTFTATVGQWSPTVRYNVPAGASGPLVLSVHSFLTDHRCKTSIYGSLSTQETAACNAGNAFYDIPLKTNAANPTECVSFEIQFATDYTYDLP